MRKFFSILFFALALSTSGASAQSLDSRFSLSVDGLALEALPSQGNPAAGFGGSLFLDWRPLDFISFGTGLEFSGFSRAPGAATGAWDLGGRLFPFGPSDGDEFYLQGGLGLSLIHHSFSPASPGSLRGDAGFGYRFSLSHSMALDLGAQYEIFSPLSQALQSLGAKAGLVFLFGDIPAGPLRPKVYAGEETSAVKNSKAEILWPKPALKKAPAKRTKRKKGKHRKPKIQPTPTPDANAPLTYTWAPGDNLDSIAEAYYGRGNLYPLLVDANRKALVVPQNLKTGAQILIPQNVSEAQKDQARDNAGRDLYIPWEKVGVRP